MSELVEIRGLTKVYEKIMTSLDNFNLTIGRGRIIGLLGPNGSGKTTLIKLMNGLLEATEGEVLMNGHRPGPQTKNWISYLPERTYFHNNMRVDELIRFFCDFYQDFRPERARQMLSNLNISENAKLKTLSKGTKEKVQLIMVMSRQAQLYLLDEPIAGVDPAARDYILKTIITNYNPEATVIVSTHLISDIENILDQVIFIKEGEIFLQASVDDIRMQHQKSIDALFREVFKC